MTARDFVEQNRAVAPVHLGVAVLVLALVAAEVLGIDLGYPRARLASIFFAGCALLCLGLRDRTARVDTEDTRCGR